MPVNLTHKQAMFKKYFLDPDSDTYGNPTASALAAGYPEEYAKKLDGSGVDFASELVRDFKRLAAAEKVLSQTLALVDDEDVGRQKLAQDSAKFIAKTLGRVKYAERQEHTGKDGVDLPTPILNINALRDNDSDKENRAAG